MDFWQAAAITGRFCLSFVSLANAGPPFPHQSRITSNENKRATRDGLTAIPAIPTDSPNHASRNGATLTRLQRL
jgi:hypothetical protein